jgi:hypothetical protein
MNALKRNEEIYFVLFELSDKGFTGLEGFFNDPKTNTTRDIIIKLKYVTMTPRTTTIGDDRYDINDLGWQFLERHEKYKQKRNINRAVMIATSIIAIDSIFRMLQILHVV